MEGGAGDDVYVVDDAGDVVVEAAGEGIDIVFSSIGIFLPDNIERLTLTGIDAIDVTGNDDDNTLIGNDGANRLVGRDGNDTLIGGGGADTLVGGTGDDYYEIENAGDAIVELAGQGDDFVRTKVSYTLPENAERLAADGTADLALAGNTQGNGLFGNAGSNVLTGGKGDDYLVGGAGNDVYVFNRGDGQDAIDNTDLLAATDTLRFGTGITDADVVAFRSGNNVVVKLKGATDLVSVREYYGASTVNGGEVSDHRIDRIEFANGVVWNETMIQAAVDRAATNHAPTVSTYLPTLQARAGDAFTYTVPVGTIADPDAGDSIIYSVTMQDGIRRAVVARVRRGDAHVHRHAGSGRYRQRSIRAVGHRRLRRGVRRIRDPERRRAKPCARAGDGTAGSDGMAGWRLHLHVAADGICRPRRGRYAQLQCHASGRQRAAFLARIRSGDPQLQRCANRCRHDQCARNGKGLGKSDGLRCVRHRGRERDGGHRHGRGRGPEWQRRE